MKERPMKKPDQPKPCGNPFCSVCSGALPLVIREEIGTEEPQLWKQTAKGNIVPVFVEDPPSP